MLLPNLSFHHSRGYRHCLAVTVFFGLSLVPQYSAADAGDTFNASVGTNLMYDSNVFRLSSIYDRQALINLIGQPSKSDQIITSTASLILNKTYSMQRFDLNVSLVDNRYHNFDFLNFVGKNGTGTWHWYLTPYIYGKLTGSHREALNNFASLTGFANSTNRNLRTNDSFRFDGVLELTRGWHIIGGINENVSKNSKALIQDFNNEILSVEGGVRYAFPSGSSLTYKIRSGMGRFMNRPEPIVSNLFDTRFNELEHEARLIWPVTGKTSIEARIGHLERKHVHFPQRDFAGFVGNVNLNWAVTSKTRITASWSRDLANYQTAAFAFLSPNLSRFSSSFVATNRFSITPVWKITDKTTLRLRYDYIMTNFGGAVQALPQGDRSDSMHSGMIAVDWQPLNMLAISGMLQRDHRTSSHRGFDFDSAAASVSAKLNF